MSLAKDTSRHPPRAAYKSDLSRWAEEQACLLRAGRYTEVDITNVAEEIESLGSEQRHALESSYRVLMLHLLKWQVQPERRSRSWQATVVRERGNIRRREAKNPSLRAKADEIVADVYPDAVREAEAETGLPIVAFPAECPYSLDQLRDQDWWPAETG